MKTQNCYKLRTDFNYAAEKTSIMKWRWWELNPLGNLRYSNPFTPIIKSTLRSLDGASELGVIQEKEYPLYPLVSSLCGYLASIALSAYLG